MHPQLVADCIVFTQTGDESISAPLLRDLSDSNTQQSVRGPCARKSYWITADLAIPAGGGTDYEIPRPDETLAFVIELGQQV